MMNEVPAPNPYSVSASISPEIQVRSDCAHLRRGTFLFRQIEFEAPFRATLTYDGWWFRQKVALQPSDDGLAPLQVWFRVSWVRIHSAFEFDLPEEFPLDPDWDTFANPVTRVRGEITFAKTLAIRQFRIWLGETVIYDEIR